MHTQKVFKIVYLEASESPRKAFYLLWIELKGEGFRVCKESGASAGATPLHRKAWEFQTMEEAEKLFRKLVHRKTERIASLPGSIGRSKTRPRFARYPPLAVLTLKYEGKPCQQKCISTAHS